MDNFFLYIAMVLIMITPILAVNENTTTTEGNVSYYVPPGFILIDDSKCPVDNITSCADFEIYISFTDIFFQDRFFTELPWYKGTNECKYTDTENLNEGQWICEIKYPKGMYNISREYFNVMPQSIIDSYEIIYKDKIVVKDSEILKLRIYVWLLVFIVLILLAVIYLIKKILPNTLYLGGG